MAQQFFAQGRSHLSQSYFGTKLVPYQWIADTTWPTSCQSRDRLQFYPSFVTQQGIGMQMIEIQSCQKWCYKKRTLMLSTAQRLGGLADGRLPPSFVCNVGVSEWHGIFTYRLMVCDLSYGDSSKPLACFCHDRAQGLCTKGLPRRSNRASLSPRILYAYA